MKILVTGSSGTIGTYLCVRLAAFGYQVVGADLRSNKWREEVDRITIKVDLRDSAAVMSLLPKDVDMIIHLAANARVHNLVVDPSLARDNLETLFNILEYARENGINRFFFASSREVYGNTEDPFHSEDEAMTKNCESPYTASKIGGEALVHSYQQCFGIDFCIMRFSNVYGMYDESDRIIPLFIRLCATDQDLIVYGEDKILDFTYATDAISGVIVLVDGFQHLKNEVYNIASGTGTTLVDVANMIKRQLDSQSQVLVAPSRVGEVIQYTADISKIQKQTSFAPEVPIEKGIELSVNWYSKHVLNPNSRHR